jgi:DNA-directed RNA polymerase subunit beta
VKTYEAIIKGRNIPEPGIPESFKVLLKELQSLALDVKVLREDNTEVDMKENIDEATISYNSVMSEDKNYQQQNEDFGKLGYQTQEVSDTGIEDVAQDDFSMDDMDADMDMGYDDYDDNDDEM